MQRSSGSGWEGSAAALGGRRAGGVEGGGVVCGFPEEEKNPRDTNAKCLYFYIHFYFKPKIKMQNEKVNATNKRTLSEKEQVEVLLINDNNKKTAF